MALLRGGVITVLDRLADRATVPGDMMKHDIYEMEHPEPVAGVLRELRLKVSDPSETRPGITITGNRLTIRWTSKNPNFTGLRHVHAVITEIEDGAEPEPEEISC